MRQLLIITTIFLSSLLMASVVHAKWTKVGKSVDGTFYVDFERIKKHSGMVYYWGLVDRSKPTKTGVISFKSHNESECRRFRFRHLTITFYKGPMASGTISSSHNIPEKDWRYASPDSIIEDVLKAVCNHKSMQ